MRSNDSWNRRIRNIEKIEKIMERFTEAGEKAVRLVLTLAGILLLILTIVDILVRKVLGG